VQQTSVPLTLCVQVSLPRHVDSNGFSVREVAHSADMLRLRLMRDVGGVYMDADVITVKSFDALLKVRGLSLVVQRHDPTPCRSTLLWAKRATAANTDYATLCSCQSRDRALQCDGSRCSMKFLTHAFGACTASSTLFSPPRSGLQISPFVASSFACDSNSHACWSECFSGSGGLRILPASLG
jgi:hypothetical protein